MSEARTCPHCGKVFFGTTNRRAARPLDAEAVAAANACSRKQCSRLTDPATGQTRRLTMDSGDYLCRRVWMDCYLDALDDKPEKIVPKTQKKPDQPAADCGDKGGVDPAVKCVVLSILAICEHKDQGLRSIGDGGTLDVVPSGNYGSDHIALEAKAQKVCGEHPGWTVTGESPAHGLSHAFDAAAPVTSKLWIPSFSPKSYQVRCSGCSGGGKGLKVDVYPPNELSGNIDLKKSLEIVRKITKGLELVLDTVADDFQWKYLEGRVSAQAAWKEHTDHRAFYAYSIGVKLDPLFGAEFKTTIGPGKITKLAGKIPGIGKYIKQVVEWLIKAGLYFKLGGGITVELAYKRETPDQPKFVEAVGAGVGGQVQGGLGLEGAIVGDLVKVEVEASTGIKTAASPLIDDKGFGMAKVSVDFDGLKGNCKLIFLWGVVDVNETVTFIGPSNIYGPKDMYFYTSD